MDSLDILHGPVWALAWSPDGAHLATASNDGTVRVSPRPPVTPPHRPRRHLFGRWLRPPVATGFEPAGPVLHRSGGSIRALTYAPDGETLAVAGIDGTVSLVPADPTDQRPVIRLFALPDSGWAVFYGEHRYRLHGDPTGQFWWSSGLCRFEPGELDGYGVERLDPHLRSGASHRDVTGLFSGAGGVGPVGVTSTLVRGATCVGSCSYTTPVDVTASRTAPVFVRPE